MKISLNWLKEFVSIRIPPKELARRLTMAGLEVEAFEEEEGDIFFTLNVTPNRGDCLSIAGVAREIAALQGRVRKYKARDTRYEIRDTLPKGDRPISDFVKVKVLDSKGCLRYMARAIEGVAIVPAPSWMAGRLLKAGVRPVNNIVDCTNYVLLELGHPLHAFDHRFLRKKEIIVRREAGAVSFTTLDGVERLCNPEDLFICDGEGPVAIAGVMGGANSEIRGDTSLVILEAAAFDPRRIHRTAKRLGLSSESSYRFERGVDPNGVAKALQRVTELIVQTAGGIPSRDWIDIYPKKVVPRFLALSLGEVERILGVSLSPSRMRQLLAPLGFEVRKKSKGLLVRVPTFRQDISRTVDLVEEVARTHGLEAIPDTLPQIRIGLPLRPPQRKSEGLAVETLLGLGFSEACHLVFASPEKAEIFEGDKDSHVYLANPLSEDHKILRPSLFPSLLEGLAFNCRRQRPDVKLFELGKIFLCENGGVAETRQLGLIACGKEWDLQWQLKLKPVDFYSLKGVLAALNRALGNFPLTFTSEPELPSFLDPSQAIWICVGGKKIGWLGKLQPQVLKSWEIEEEVFGAQIDWELFAQKATREIHFEQISKYPFVERDIALVVDENLPAEKIEEALRGEENNLIKKINIFDVFRGDSINQNKKSIAIHIRYATPEKTLTNEEVNQLHEGLTRRLEAKLQAQLRK